MSKSQILLNEENFNRIKKNLAKQLNLPQNVIAESLSKSMGFGNLHQAQSENFKTDKFSGNKRQTNFESLKEIQKRAMSLKIGAEKLLLFTYQEKNQFFNDVSHFVYGECLKTEDLIMSNLKGCLKLELDFGIEFDLEIWLKELNEQNLFKEMFISVNIESFFDKLFNKLKNEEEHEMIDLIREDLTLLCLKKNNVDYLKVWWSSLDLDLFLKEIDKNKNSLFLSREEISELFLTMAIEFVSVDHERITKERELLALVYYSVKTLIVHDKKLSLSGKQRSMIADKTMKMTAQSKLELHFDLLSLIVQLLEKNEQDYFKESLYGDVKSERSYLLNLKSIKSFFNI